MNDKPAAARYFFTTEQVPGSAQVGGKAASLIEMTRAGLPVPPGFVLTTDFFQPWLEYLRATQAWAAFVEAVRAEAASTTELHTRAADLRDVCAGLSFTETQQRLLSEALEDLPNIDSESDSSSDVGLFAVRSSAPQEDLVGASFAGVYDSVLGVSPRNLAETVRTVFMSGLDFAAVSYKRQRGFDPSEVEIAVVVQRQLDSASAGVAFSLNPQTNDYDEVVIQANWGLGETVVSGSVTPDQFVVDKVAGHVLDVKAGAKQTALWSRPEGGSVHNSGEDDTGSRQCALTEGQAVEVARLASRVETLTAVPVDIEWAFDAEGHLHLLQARPVTTHFPLPEELGTAPGEPRRLYADGTLLEEGLQQPLSVLGACWMADAIVEMVRQATGLRISTRNRDGLVLTVGGRWYANLSNLLWLGTERLAQSLEPLDVHAAQVLRNVDPKRYTKAGSKPTLASIARAVAGTLAHSAGPVRRTLVGLSAPKRARRRYQHAVDQRHRRLAEVARTARSMPELGDETLKPVVHLLIREGLPLTYAAEVATALIGILYCRAPRQQRKHLTTALRSMPHNITIEMGLALYRLARLLDEAAGPQIYDDLPALAQRIESRELPEPFLREWDAFLNSYGFRGPNELDLAASRYADNPALVLEQMRQYALLDESTQESPEHTYERRQQERRDAFQALLDATRNPLKTLLVKSLYRVAEEFSGYREIHKYHLILASYRVRQRALETGRSLAENDRLDSAEQVFDLTYDDLHASSDTTSQCDLRTRAHNNTRYRRQIQNTPGAHFPVIVDSRGRIPRSPRPERGPGVLAGEGVSAGTARGPAKVLNHVGEKPVLPGDILIARATDPGWTPLFVNAAGIILESGGSFQHGALVAREYGKPCLVAVDRATERLTEGQFVELDGTNGTATIVPTPSEEHS